MSNSPAGEFLTASTSSQLLNKQVLLHACNHSIRDNKSELYRLFFHAVYQANPDVFTEVLHMQRLERDPEVQKKIDDLVRTFEWDKKWKEEGLQEGLQRGLQEGLEQGIEKGIKKGMKEGKLAVALKLLAKGMPLHEVAEVTGLSMEQLEQIRCD
jgi:predicted transposase/invertase (TIGR01784 family)